MGIRSPAYFGESCLWVPFRDWTTKPVPRFLYTAMCHSRTELVYIPRSAVQNILERFSPWLVERFEFFQDSVMETFTQKCPELAKRPQDWASLGLSAAPYVSTQSLRQARPAMPRRASYPIEAGQLEERRPPIFNNGRRSCPALHIAGTQTPTRTSVKI